MIDDGLLRQMVVSLIKMNYFWTRVGIDQNEADRRIVLLQTRLIQVLERTVEDEEAEFWYQCQRIHRLKLAIEAVLQDLASLLDPAQLTELIKSQCDNSIGNNQIDSCFLVQRTILKNQHRDLLELHKRVKTFPVLKEKVNSTLNLLGLTKAIDPECAAILGKSIANNEDIKCLQEYSRKYDDLLIERQLYWRTMTRKIVSLSRLVPLQLDQSYLWNDTCEQSIIFSEENQTKLQHQYELVHQTALVTWRQLYESFQRLDQLYGRFNVTSNLRHPIFNTINKIPFDSSEQNANLPDLDQLEEENVTMEMAEEALQLEYAQYLRKERITELIALIRRQFVDLLSNCALLISLVFRLII